MDEAGLQTFVTIARLGRVTPAARELGVSQPTLTRRLQGLEREVGASLLVRQSSGLRLTSAGERFLEHAIRSLDALRAGRDALAEVAGGLRGQVSIGAIPSVGTYALPDIVARFHREHPDVRIALTEALPVELEAAVVSGQADLVIVNLPVRRKELTTRTLWREEYVLAVPADHPLATGTGPVSLDEIAKEPLVAVASSPATHAVIAAAESKGIHARLVVAADNHESVRRMVARGIGVALVPQMMTRVTTPQVTYREIGRGVPRRRVALVHRGEAALSGAARALRDTVVAAFARRGKK